MAEEIEDIKPGVEPMLTRLDIMRPIIEEIMRGNKKLSYSSLSAFIDSPKDFSDYCLRQRVETAAMIYGSMVHCLVLEPSQFEARYFVIEDRDICEQIGGAKPRAANKYKAWKADQMAFAGGRIIVLPQDYAHARVVAYNVRTNRASAKIMQACPRREMGVEWEFLNFGFRGFIDLDGDNDTADLKTMPDANREVVDREIKRRRLYLQQCGYRLGLKAKAAIEGIPWKAKAHHIIAVDKLGGTSVHTIDEKLMAYGMEEMTHYVKKFNYAYVTEAWDDSQNFYGHPWTGRFVCEPSGYQLNREF